MPSHSALSILPLYQSRNSSEFRALQERGFILGKKIGKGSYATVLEAEYEDKGKKIPLACKIVDKSKVPSDFLSKFFDRELEIITKLDHPFVIQTHTIMKRGPKVYIFMRFAENGDLLEYIKSRGAIPEHQAKVWFFQMVKGLKYLHKKGIVHRDLKCENILISKNNNIKIADFGFSRQCEALNENIMSRTYCGSSAYAAPEVVIGKPYNPKMADVWSLGVILFIMLNAKMPFEDKNLMKLIEDQKSQNFQFRKGVEQKLSTRCKALVSLILDPNVSTRWTLDRIEKSMWFKDSAMVEGVPN